MWKTMGYRLRREQRGLVPKRGHVIQPHLYKLKHQFKSAAVRRLALPHLLNLLVLFYIIHA